jgi:hypothetical protein
VRKDDLSRHSGGGDFSLLGDDESTLRSNTSHVVWYVV